MSYIVTYTVNNSVGFVVCIAVCTSHRKWQIFAWLNVSCDILFRNLSSFWAQIGLIICSVESFFGLSSIAVISNEWHLAWWLVQVGGDCAVSPQDECLGGESGLSGVSSSQASTQQCSLRLGATIYLCSAKFIVVRRWQEESHWFADRASMDTRPMESISSSRWRIFQLVTINGADTEISSQENQKG